jgi:GNAT superfamily N-acetyltransferase
MQFPTDAEVVKIAQYCEQFFGTENDPDQAPATAEVDRGIISVARETYVVTRDLAGEPIAWSLAIPTSRALRDEFLAGIINERVLIELAVANPSMEALYHVLVQTLPEHRGRGLGFKIAVEQLEYFVKQVGVVDIYCWIWSREGERLVQRFSDKLGVNYAVKQTKFEKSK